MNPFGMDVGDFADGDRIPDADEVFRNFRNADHGDDRRSRREWREGARGGFVVELRRSRGRHVREKS